MPEAKLAREAELCYATFLTAPDARDPAMLEKPDAVAGRLLRKGKGNVA